jgi:sorbitol-specific phosphotransferase system component IIA
MEKMRKDCSRVYVTLIGDTPTEKLKELGILPLVYSGPIARIAR